ncbi:6-phosphofructokinase [Candidatus Pelagibacter communis]|uniref:6-phosphofructokinase n=1 Tax=Pelagibacter ubique TaxID=198252 RepID=UPI00094D4C1F|nr:6-phosphofructokinase [Candidatus Pelagibacter ubique]
MSSLLILMSGGTTPVINSTLIGILKVLKKKRIKVFSGMPGLDGVLNDQFLNLSNLSQTKIRLLRNTPGSHFTGTSRLKKLTNSEILKLKSIFLKKKISKVINIGGNGTLKQSIDLSLRLPEVNFISCPKTVDNDLGDNNFNKMLYNPGFITCIEIWKFFLEMINIENIGASSHDKIIISQTFGRETGFICGSIRYWDKKRKLPIMLLLPEDKQNFNKIYYQAKKILKKKKRLMIFMSEGYEIGNINPKKDKSGQIMYGSSGNTNCQLLNNKFIAKGVQSRVFNPTILQRVFKFYKNKLCEKDKKIAEKIGETAANTLLNDKKSYLIGFSKNHKIDLIKYEDCKNFSRNMPNKFILKNKFDVSNVYLKYLEEVIKR